MRNESVDDRLAENMVISIAPGIYLPKTGGFRHSDTVLVAKDRFEVLTTFPDALDDLVLSRRRPLVWSRDHLVRRARHI